MESMGYMGAVMARILIVLLLLCSSICYAGNVKVVLYVDKTAPKAVLRAKMDNYGVKYHVLNIRNDKILFDCIIDVALVKPFKMALETYNIKIIGAWKQDGIQVGRQRLVDEFGSLVYSGVAEYTFDKLEYLNLAPDTVTYDKDDVPILTRPTVEKEFHNYFGWGSAVYPKDEL